MNKAIVIISAILLVACASYKPIVPAQSDADRAAKNNPGVTLADLEQGRAIFEKSCHKCHSLKRPFAHTPEEIETVIPKMAKRAKLNSQQQELVLNYLVTMNPNQESK
jgi:cytochrome c5